MQWKHKRKMFDKDQRYHVLYNIFYMKELTPILLGQCNYLQNK